MNYFYAAICIIICIISLLHARKILNPVSLITLLWSVIITLSSMRIYGLYKVDDKWYDLIFIGIITFCFGYFAYEFILGKKSITIGKKKVIEEVSINYKLCCVLLLICLLFVTGRIVGYGNQIIRSGFNLTKIGHLIADNQVEYTGVLNAIYFLVVTPLYLPLTVLFGIEIWVKKPNKLFMVLGMIMVAGRILITGGRIAIIQLFISAILGMSFSGGEQRASIQKRIKAIIKRPLGIASIVALVAGFIALSFTKTSKTLAEHLLLDFAIQPNEFSYWGNYIGDQYAYGIASLYGFFHPFIYIIRNVFGIRDFGIFDKVYENIQLTFENWVQTGTTIYSNAYATSFWYLFYDFRGLGIAIGMFIWGFISCHYYLNAIKKPNVRNISLYIMIAIGIVYTFTDMEFYKASYVLGLCYVPFLIKRNKRKSLW